MHTPVLLQQAIDNLNVKPGGKYIDATFGEGGYSREILKRGGQVLAIDVDRNQIEKTTLKDKNLTLVEGNFSDIENLAKKNKFGSVDGVVFDLGLSMGQLDEGGKGLSYNKPYEELDMRIGSNLPLTATELIFKSTEDELYNILAGNSEELKSREIAIELKKRKKIKTVANLLSAIDSAAGFKSRTVYARIFQALRIAVNNEFENLKAGLKGSANIIKKDGRIVIVSFHSLEDRIVKKFGKTNKFKFLNDKVISGVKGRHFERSAKIRTLQYE